jgi:hypothetical protein
MDDNNPVFIEVDDNDPKGTAAVFYLGEIEVRIYKNHPYVARNTETGYGCNIRQSDLSEMEKIAHEKLNITGNKHEVTVEILSEEKPANEIVVCPYPDCRGSLGTEDMAATLGKCPHCERRLGDLVEITEDDGIQRRTFRRGIWV